MKRRLIHEVCSISALQTVTLSSARDISIARQTRGLVCITQPVPTGETGRSQETTRTTTWSAVTAELMWFWLLASPCRLSEVRCPRDVVFISTANIDFYAENWINVPTNTILTISNETAFIEDIRDQFYTSDPWQRRSAGFVHSKGLVANEKTSSPPALPSPSLVVTDSNRPGKIQNSQTHLGPNTTYNLLRSGHPQPPQSGTLASPTDNGAPEIVPRQFRATVSIGSTAGNTDVRSITISPDAMSPQRTPSQGNIKKKRMSLSDLPQAQGQANTENSNSTPLSPVERNTAFGDPAKIAQFFPELTLAP